MNTKQLRISFWLSVIISFASLAPLGMIDSYLKNALSPLGIVSFEFCAYQSNCEPIVASWTGTAHSMAAMSLGLDYLFMLAYSAAICFGLLLAAPNLPSALQRLALLFAWGIWIAGGADAIENYHLFQMLLGQPVAAHQWGAAAAATIKFAIVVPALVVWLLATLWPRLSSSKRHKTTT